MLEAGHLRRSFLAGALAVLTALTPVAVLASDAEHGKAPPEAAHKGEAKAAEAKATEPKPGDAKVGEKKPDPKANDPKPGDPKAGAPKTEARTEAKPGEAKSGEAKSGEAKSGEAKSGEAKSGEAKVAAGTDEEAPQKRVRPKTRKKVAAPKEPPPIPGEGPSPASPPPLNMAGLRDEARRESGSKKIDPGASPRTKVEQMLSEIGKTREALHGETIKLEALLATEPAEGAAATAGAAAGAGGAGGKPAKHPLDIVAKALRGIKPEQAAPIVSRLDRRLAATVLQRMPPVDAGKIMGAMKPDTAAELATQIALRSPESKK